MNTIRRAVMGGALVGSTLLGGALGATLLNGSAVAQSTTTTPTQSPDGTTPTTPTDPATPVDPREGPGGPGRGPGRCGHGNGEELLTGETAEKVEAAALAAVPGGTVERVETDAEGSPYEAHVRKADGSHVTVKVDSEFNVTSVEEGHR